MKAILFDQPGGVEELYIGTIPTPQPGPDEILVRVAATALNRADLMQRQGKYPAPPGASEVLGLEMSGTVEMIGDEVEGWKVGDKLCALLPGGGYAEYVVIPAAMAMPLPSGFGLVEAAAVPEVFLTAFQALDWLADLQAGEHVLIHAGASGVGTAAIQIAREKGARIWVTASKGKHDICLNLGAEKAIDYKSKSFAEIIQKETKDGVDVILDFIAAPYFNDNLQSLRRDGRLVMLSLMGGIHPEKVNLLPVLRNRLHIMGSTLRSRSLDYKVALSQAFQDFAAEKFAQGHMKPVIDTVFAWEDVQSAHKYMHANQNQGKILLKISAP